MTRRFIVKNVKIVWRNSMLVGNPVERSFQKFGVYDRNWQEDPYCACPRPGGEWATNNGQSRKFRVVVDDHELALKIASKLNDLFAKVPNAKIIDFNGLTSWMRKDEDVEKITVKEIKC